ncbi:MAG: UvrD-helicase domain-containing protein, partial [Desulfobulbaceae bacterium]|nr:UvrD-helicase domain-containing protein [Desulfobulbaceae bacterium]
MSTFTEKAGAELKNRIYKKLKEEIYKEKSEQLHDNFYEIQNSFIGTLHSLLLRILKSHPEISKITDKTRIVDSIEFEAVFTEVFDEFIIEDKKRTDEIINLLENKNDVKKLFR